MAITSLLNLALALSLWAGPCGGLRLEKKEESQERGVGDVIGSALTTYYTAKTKVKGEAMRVYDTKVKGEVMTKYGAPVGKMMKTISEGYSKHFNPHDPHNIGAEAWFDEAVEGGKEEKSLHKRSQWSYMSDDDWKAFVLHGTAQLNPPIKSGESVYDMGCGVGAALKVLQDQHKLSKVGGVDLSGKSIEFAQESTFPDQKENFLKGSFTDAPLLQERVPSASYDHVIGVGTLFYLGSLDDVKIAVHEALRIVKPGGSLVFTDLTEPGHTGLGSGSVQVSISDWKSIAEEFGAHVTCVEAMGKWDGSVLGDVLNATSFNEQRRFHQKQRYAISIQASPGSHLQGCSTSSFQYDF